MTARIFLSAGEPSGVWIGASLMRTLKARLGDDVAFAGLGGGAMVDEGLRLIFDPAQIGYDDLLRTFWEGHDPTQGMRQGNDIGTQYRSGVYAYDAGQRGAAERSKADFAPRLAEAGYGAITT